MAPLDALWPASEFQVGPNGEQIGVHGESQWLYSTPGGMRNALVWVGARYASALPIVISESGCSVPREKDRVWPQGALDDQWRMAFLYEYMQQAARARIIDGVNLQVTQQPHSGPAPPAPAPLPLPSGRVRVTCTSPSSPSAALQAFYVWSLLDNVRGAGRRDGRQYRAGPHDLTSSTLPLAWWASSLNGPMGMTSASASCT